jgi:TetR/AcrR family transcriptional regulator
VGTYSTYYTLSELYSEYFTSRGGWIRISKIFGGLALSEDPSKISLETLIAERELYENPLTEKQKSILEAAESLFAEAGFSETSTAAIARKAGVTEKTLFKHFPTKQDLLRRILFPLILRTIVPMQVRMMRKFFENAPDDFEGLFVGLALNRWAELRQLGPRIKIVIIEVLQDSHLRQQAQAIFLEHAWPIVLERIKHFQKRGDIRQDVSTEDIATLITTLIIGQGMRRAILAPDVPYDDERDARILCDLIFSGVKG